MEYYRQLFVRHQGIYQPCLGGGGEDCEIWLTLGPYIRPPRKHPPPPPPPLLPSLFSSVIIPFSFL